MTTPKAPRFHLRRTERIIDPNSARKTAPVAAGAPPNSATAAAADPRDTLFDNHDDGFGGQKFQTAGQAAPKQPAAPREPLTLGQAEAKNDAIRKENLTVRQLRAARNLAQHHKLNPTSDYDAVRLLREAGIDPFQRSSLLDIIAEHAGLSQQNAAETPLNRNKSLTPLPGDGVQLPQTVKPIQLPSPEQRVEVNHAAEIVRMQREIAQRRRRKLMLLFARLFAYIFLPTMVAAWYFSFIATPLYSTKAEFVIQQAENPTAAGGMGGLLQGTGMATSQDSIAVQGYLQSRDAMLRLEKDHGFRSHFTGDDIDLLLRLPPDASIEDAYKLYKRYVLISYDPSEGLIRMEVTAPDPETSAIWSEQLIKYAEEQVDRMTQRLREDSMRGAGDSYEDATKAVVAAQRHLIDLQEKYKVLSSETELSLLTQQIGSLETQLIQERLSLAQMESNPAPNAARMEPIKRRIATLETQIADLRRSLTEGKGDSASLAHIQGELLVAQADVQTRQMILATSLQAMENARTEANRQVRYLSIAVSPTPPDEPSYPRVFENTMVTMLILFGIYLMISMTIAILREQVSA